LRILYHHRTSARDGSAVHIDGLVTALTELGAEVRVVAPPLAAPDVASPAKSSWIPAVRRRLPRFAHELGELSYNGPEAARLLRALGEFKPDVIYQRSNLYLLSGAWAAARARIPLIEEVNAPYFLERSRHGGIALRSLAQWAERSAWREADAVVTVTGVLADLLAAQGVSRDRLHVMPNGIDRSLLRPEAVDTSAKQRLGLTGFTVLGFTGFVRDWNGLADVIDQLALPRGQRWFLLVVGDGPARDALERRARQLGVSARLRFTGVVRRSEVARHVSAFDLALQPAANPYASPLKLFEYMALGRAIVAPDQPNIREILTPDHDAVLFDPAEPGALGVAVMRLASDEGLRLRLAAAAAETVTRRQLTWRHNAEQVLALAAQLSAGHGPSPRMAGSVKAHH
jgi:glycosyltransferase involved in cell wall biosynthesis